MRPPPKRLPVRFGAARAKVDWNAAPLPKAGSARRGPGNPTFRRLSNAPQRAPRRPAVSVLQQEGKPLPKQGTLTRHRVATKERMSRSRGDQSPNVRFRPIPDIGGSARADDCELDQLAQIIIRAPSNCAINIIKIAFYGTAESR